LPWHENILPFVLITKRLQWLLLQARMMGSAFGEAHYLPFFRPVLDSPQKF
jgi:hypothetical protein